MKGWTLETAYQDDIFGVMPVALIPHCLATETRSIPRTIVRQRRQNLVYIPKQFLRIANPTEHLARLWQCDPGQVHLITDERLVVWRVVQSHCSNKALWAMDPSS